MLFRSCNVGGDLGSAIKGFKSAMKEEESKPEDTVRIDKGADVIEGEVASKVTTKEQDKV